MSIERAFEGSSLCVVGNINRDVKTAPFHPGPQLFQDGESSVASVVETIGGGGANSAFAAVSLGARAAFLGKIGADGLGRRLLATLTRHGIAAYLAQSADHPSGTSIALTFDTGQRHFISCLPANEALTFADLDLTALGGCAHLLRADIWFSREMLFEGNKTLFQHARQSGLAVSIDLNWDPQWGQSDAATIKARKDAVRAALPWVDVAHGNVRELREFADAQDLETALKRLADWGVQSTVIHLGAKGAGHYHQGLFVVEPPGPMTAPVHSTGSGDVLSVCMMLLHRRKEMEIAQRLRLANAVVAQFMEGKRQMIPKLED